jgi:hypothetical protein
MGPCLLAHHFCAISSFLVLRPDLVLHLVALYSALEQDHVVLLPLLLAGVAMYRQPRWT